LDRHTKILNIEKDPLIKALQYIKSSAEDNPNVTLTFTTTDEGQQVKLHSENKDKTGSADTTLLLQNTQNLDDMQLRCSIDYLTEACRVIETPLDEIRIQDANSFLIVLPPDDINLLQVVAVVRI
jgi:DNA polymerase III sliding clamp (beta) subunit (PCNA family)